MSLNVLTENRKARIVHQHITVHNLARFNFSIYICNAEEFKVILYKCFLVCFATGLKVAAKIFPQSLISGTLPPSITREKPREFNPATQQTFSADDIDALEMQLDNALEDKSVSSK